jgi:hypothetical protein
LLGHSDLVCAAPAFVNQPALTLASEAQLDHFNFHLSNGSPANRRGIPVNGIAADYYGSARPTPPSIGAVEPSR